MRKSSADQLHIVHCTCRLKCQSNFMQERTGFAEYPRERFRISWPFAAVESHLSISTPKSTTAQNLSISTISKCDTGNDVRDTCDVYLRDNDEWPCLKGSDPSLDTTWPLESHPLWCRELPPGNSIRLIFRNNWINKWKRCTKRWGESDPGWRDWHISIAHYQIKGTACSNTCKQDKIEEKRGPNSVQKRIIEKGKYVKIERNPEKKILLLYEKEILHLMAINTSCPLSMHHTSCKIYSNSLHDSAHSLLIYRNLIVIPYSVYTLFDVRFKNVIINSNPSQIILIFIQVCL